MILVIYYASIVVKLIATVHTHTPSHSESAAHSPSGCFADEADNKAPLPFSLRMMLWNCRSNCEYDCMRANHRFRQQNGELIVKYQGKWPFIRVMGMQELFSVLFSIGNAIPHIVYGRRYRSIINPRYHMKNWWSAYSFVAINTVGASCIR